MNSELWPFQVEALKNIRESVRSGVRRLVAQSPTASGKTKISAAIVDGALQKGNRIAFVVPAISLVDQTLESFWNEGIRDVGILQSNHERTNWAKPVQICSIQTIHARKRFPEAQTVIFDEVHQMHRAHIAWLQAPEYQNVPFIGLSATPWSRGLGKYWESLLVVSTIKELIAGGYLSPFRAFATGHPDLTGVKIVAGDYHEEQLSGAMQQGELVADIVRTWKEKWGKDKTLCFGVDKAHAQSIQKRFEEAGISCGYQDANTPMAERREIKRKFHSGEYRVISNIQTLCVGVDFDVRCLILARPTRSESLLVQIVGRGLRTNPEKRELIFLDHSDTTQRLGLVTDIHHEHLDDGSKKATAAEPERKVPLPKECKQCAFLKPAGVVMCPNCGFKAETVSGITERDGELIEIVPGYTARKNAEKADKKKTWTMEEKLSFFAQLKAYADERGYKPGWAAMKHKDKFGTFPNDWRFKEVAPAPPTAGMLSWIKSRQIAWAKSRKRTEDKPNGSAIAERDQRILDKVREQFIPGTLMTEKDLEDFR